MSALLMTPGVEAAEIRKGALTVKSHGLTDLGKRRSRNEDQFLIATLTQALCVNESSIEQDEVQYGEPQGHLFVVADGMGGHASGDQASAMAVHTVESFMVGSINWCTRLRGDGVPVLEEFQKALKRADTDIAGTIREHPDLQGMGTTLTVAYLVGQELFVAHAGDSRCYLLRDGKLRLLTHDHTLVQEMVDRGIISQEAAATHEMRHIIANVVGGPDAGVKVELHKLLLVSGDQLLLCSDGLTGMVTDKGIATIMEQSEDPREACNRLVNRANELGGKDNITVIVVHC